MAIDVHLNEKSFAFNTYQDTSAENTNTQIHKFYECS